MFFRLANIALQTNLVLGYFDNVQKFQFYLHAASKGSSQGCCWRAVEENFPAEAEILFSSNDGVYLIGITQTQQFLEQ